MKDNLNETKKNMIYRRIQDDIRYGVFKSEERLVVSDIAAKYKVSIIPVREAMQTLTQEGVLHYKPNVGFFVSKISRHDVENIFSVRIVLEALAVKLVVEKAADEDIHKLMDMIDESEKLATDPEYQHYWKFNRKWHLALYELSDNDQLVRILTELYDCSFKYPDYYTSLEQVKTSIKNHRRICETIARRDVEMAVSLIKVHTIESRYQYLDRIEAVLGDRFGD